MSIWFKPYTLDDLNLYRGKEDNHLNKHLGIEFLEIGEDYLKARMPVDGRTKQPFGLLHGGASCVLSESLGSIAAWMCLDPEKERAVGLEINASHLRPVFDGFVTGICKPVKIGRTVHLWQTDMFTGEGKMNCTSRLTVAIRPLSA